MSPFKRIHTDNYCIDELKCICEECKNVFWDYIPSNYELICFSLDNGEKRFLPTYGKYGYLDLMEKLLDNWQPSDKITMAIYNEFERKIQKITPYKVTLSNKTKCPLCCSYNIKIDQKNFNKKIKVKWLEIDADYLNKIKSL